MSILVKRDRDTLFTTPFHRDYWRLAFAEVKDIRMLAIAAIVIAVRVALHPYAIPLLPTLKINLSFWIVAAGAMIYGPIVGALGGAVSDTLSSVIFSDGPYFFPYIFVEMLGGFLFGLVLYRQKLSGIRIFVSRITVSVVCNLILNPIIHVAYYNLFMQNKAYTAYSVALAVIKNLLLLAPETLILFVFLSAIVIPMKSMGLLSKNQPKIYLKKSYLIFAALLFVLSVLVVIGILYFGLYDHLKQYLPDWLRKIVFTRK